MTDIDNFEATFDPNTKTWMVYEVLRDHEWHCRECEYEHIGINQIAGGSGIQGLQRGTKTRPGMQIDSDNHLCTKCDRRTRHDRWEGNFNRAIPGTTMPSGFVQRAMNLLESRDIIELTVRAPSQLTIDHKLPQLRWTVEEGTRQTDYGAMSNEDIRDKFQLLKKSNGSVSHNLLKSRACENCYKKGQRGTPFGIQFFYAGNNK